METMEETMEKMDKAEVVDDGRALELQRELDAVDAILDAGGVSRTLDRLGERPATRLQRVDHVVAVSRARGDRLDEAAARIAELEDRVSELTTDPTELAADSTGLGDQVAADRE